MVAYVIRCVYWPKMVTIYIYLHIYISLCSDDIQLVLYNIRIFIGSMDNEICFYFILIRYEQFLSDDYITIFLIVTLAGSLPVFLIKVVQYVANNGE